MSKKRKVKKLPDQVELDRKIRKNWGEVNPGGQIFRDKTKYRRKEKYKKDYIEIKDDY